MAEQEASWIILQYHNVSWEDTPWTRAIRDAVCPPDVFSDHLRQISKAGELVSVSEAMKRILGGVKSEKPLFSIWFDGGFGGVRRYALPLLNEMNLTGAVSVSSRMWQRREMFWLCQLSYFRSCNGLSQLQKKLQPMGYRKPGSVLDFVFDNFSPEIIREILSLYMRLTDETERKNAFSLFEDEAGIREFKKAGWVIANQTASCYPVGETPGEEMFNEQFSLCEEEYEKLLGEPSRYWVLPFDREDKRGARIAELFQEHAGDRVLVLVGNRKNTGENCLGGALARVRVPLVKGGEFRRFLKGIK